MSGVHASCVEQSEPLEPKMQGAARGGCDTSDTQEAGSSEKGPSRSEEEVVAVPGAASAASRTWAMRNSPAYGASCRGLQTQMVCARGRRQALSVL